jgi:uncharacterized protein YbbK (DUF523 family)
MKKNMKLISSCLVGFNCRYDCKSKSNNEMIELINSGQGISVCPEQLGGLPTPRPPSEIKDQKVLTNSGEDVTEEFHRGAEEAMKLLELYQIDEAYLKSNSPMCGYKKIHDGNFQGNLIDGNGIFTQYLIKKNIKINSKD